MKLTHEAPLWQGYVVDRVKEVVEGVRVSSGEGSSRRAVAACSDCRSLGTFQSSSRHRHLLLLHDARAPVMSWAPKAFISKTMSKVMEGVIGMSIPSAAVRNSRLIPPQPSTNPKASLPPRLSVSSKTVSTNPSSLREPSKASMIVSSKLGRKAGVAEAN